MTATLLDKMLAEDKVWDTLSSALVGRTIKTTGRGFNSFNCPACVRMGQPRNDTKKRCSVKYDAQGIGINCFNCGLKVRFQKGGLLSKKMELFLETLGVSQSKIKELYFWAWEIKRLLHDANIELPNVSPSFFHSGFPTSDLPEKAKPIIQLADEDCDDEDFLDVIKYLFSRGDELTAATDYHWTPSTKNNMHRRLIIPFYYEDRIVGYTGRSIDDIKPKYFNKFPEGYLFNCNVMNLNRKYMILTEGIFDALAIDGVGLQSNELNDKKVNWINSSKQTKILVPDRDQSGGRLVDIAMQNGWHVAFPRTGSGSNQWWDDDIKDIADAVKRYGKLWTLRSIISTATTNTMAISMGRLHLNTHRKRSFDDGE